MKKQFSLIFLFIIPLALSANHKTPELGYIQTKKHIIGVFFDGFCSRAPLPTAANDSLNAALSGINGSVALGVINGNGGPFSKGNTCGDTDEDLENRVSAPTVVFFDKKKSGTIEKVIRFFDTTCPYQPLSLQVYKKEITLIARIKTRTGDILTDANADNSGAGISILGGLNTVDFTNNTLYPDCDFEIFGNKTYVEIRNFKSGKLIDKFTLPDVDSHLNP